MGITDFDPDNVSAIAKKSDWQVKYENLTSVVRQIYFAAHWSPDRPVANEFELWEWLRDLADIPAGHSFKILNKEKE